MKISIAGYLPNQTDPVSEVSFSEDHLFDKKRLNILALAIERLYKYAASQGVDCGKMKIKVTKIPHTQLKEVPI